MNASRKSNQKKLPRKPYMSPRLRTLGDLRMVTASGSLRQNENNRGRNTKNRP